MIPKTIHYCWFGGKPLPDDVKAYMETWRQHFPDFKIKQWDESNFDVNALKYTRQAYYAKRFAFVSDVARLHALVSEGGLYLDTDILIKRPFPSEWFDLDGFGSFEHDIYVQTGVMAASKGNPIMHEFLEQYNDRSFFKGLNYDITTNVKLFTDIMSGHGFIMNNYAQTVNGFSLFPQEYLCANDWKTGRYDSDETYAIHDFGGAWGRDALKSILKYRINTAYTIFKWHITGNSTKAIR